MPKFCVLVTCHNRKDGTLRCLSQLFKCSLSEETLFDVILVDDGSTDGTGKEVERVFSTVRVIRGNGSLFWNGGMHVAFAKALETGYDGYLWLNDDTLLYPNALNTLCKSVRDLRSEPAILVGSTVDAVSGAITYGGLVSSHRMKPLSLNLVRASGELADCDTLNGNFVYVPHAVAAAVGNVDPAFVHAMGDIDYGFRARALGFRILLLTEHVGTCSRNSSNGTYRDRSVPRLRRWREIRGPKGLPPKAWWRLVARHGGPFWPVYAVWPYVRAVL